MTTTQITTAARRIARTLGQTPTYMDAIFDDEGRLIEAVGHGNVNPAISSGLRLRGGHITQAEAQEAINLRDARLAR
jgi:hypothetical protein